jgi:membrane protease YdiL (CAAX protease family)
LFVITGVAAAQLIIGLFGEPAATPAISILSIFIALLAVYLSYRLYVRWIEKRQDVELAASGAIQELASGMLIGFGIVTTVMIILWALGSYQVFGLNPWLILIPAAAANIPSGFVQEILFRGILLRITEETLGTWIALAVSALLFGLVHIFSSGATLFSTLSIVLEAGILLGAAYLLTKRLWLAIGIHIAWDFAVDGIFGVGSTALSGKPMQGILQARLTGMDLLSGGTHGVEASVVAIIVTLIFGCFLTWAAWRRKKFVSPLQQIPGRRSFRSIMPTKP